MTRFRALLILLAAPLVFAAAAPAEAATRAFTYQGKLGTLAGTLLGGPVGTTFCFKFSLWSTPAVGSGTRQWPAAAPGTTQRQVKSGLFSAAIGVDTPEVLDFDFTSADSFLQIEIAPFTTVCGAYETLGPRQRLTSAGNAVNAELLAGSAPGTAANNILKLNGTGGISLSGGNVGIAGTAGTLTLQGGASGDLQFFSSANKITSTGNLSAAGSANFGGTGTFGNSLTAPSGSFTGASALSLGTSSAATGSLTFRNSGNGNVVTVSSGTTTASYALALPPAQGAANTVLRNDGAGALSWVPFGGCVDCVLNGSNVTDLTNTVAPTGDVTSLSLKRTSGATVKDTFAVSNAAATATYLKVGSTGQVQIAPAAGEDALVSLGAGSQLGITATAAPTRSLVSISNVGTPVTTNNVNGLVVAFVGGAAAVEAAGIRVDLTPGTAGTWSGLRVVSAAAPAGAVASGLKLDGPGAPSAGTEIALNVGTGWDVGLSLASGGITLATQTEPAAPAAGNLRVFAGTLAGKGVLSVKGPFNAAGPLQISLAKNVFTLITPNNGTTLTSLGTDASSTGTISHPAASQAVGYMANFASAAVINSVAGTGGAPLNFFRGAGAGSNGFLGSFRIYLPDAQAKYSNTVTGSRLFAGFTDQSVITSVTSDSPAGNRAGFSFVPNRDGDGTVKFVTRDGTTEAVGATGMQLLAGKVYDLSVFASPQGTDVSWQIENLTDGTSATGTVTANLPLSTVALRPATGIATLEALSHNFRLQRIYVESDR